MEIVFLIFIVVVGAWLIFGSSIDDDDECVYCSDDYDDEDEDEDEDPYGLFRDTVDEDDE